MFSRLVATSRAPQIMLRSHVDFFRCRFWEFQGEKISINRKKSEKTKNDPIIPAVVCSYTLKCYIVITLIYYQCKVNKIWHF